MKLVTLPEYALVLLSIFLSRAVCCDLLLTEWTWVFIISVQFYSLILFFSLLSHLLVLFLKNSICVFRSLFFLYFNMGGTGFATSERFRHSPALKLRFSLSMATVLWNKHWSSVSETDECSELWPQGTSRGDLENSQSYGMLSICW